MPHEYYDVLAVTASYWFAFLGIVIVWRAMRWLRTDAALRKQVLRELPDAGYIGTLYVLAGAAEYLMPGDTLSLPAEGIMGSAAGCDVRITHDTVASRHALFSYQPDGLHLRPYRDHALMVDGMPLAAPDEAILHHGATLELGAVVLQLRMFAGITAATRTPDGDLLSPKAHQQPRKRKAQTPTRRARTADAEEQGEGARSASAPRAVTRTAKPQAKGKPKEAAKAPAKPPARQSAKAGPAATQPVKPVRARAQSTSRPAAKPVIRPPAPPDDNPIYGDTPKKRR